jgi:hypothetical protein
VSSAGMFKGFYRAKPLLVKSMVEGIPINAILKK